MASARLKPRKSISASGRSRRNGSTMNRVTAPGRCSGATTGGRRYLRRHLRHDLDRRDKTIASSRHGLDESRRLARVAQHLSDLENGRVDTCIGVGEDLGAPHLPSPCPRATPVPVDAPAAAGGYSIGCRASEMRCPLRRTSKAAISTSNSPKRYVTAGGRGAHVCVTLPTLSCRGLSLLPESRHIQDSFKTPSMAGGAAIRHNAVRESVRRRQVENRCLARTPSPAAAKHQETHYATSRHRQRT